MFGEPEISGTFQQTSARVELQPSRDIVCWSINQEGASKISKVEPEKIGKTWGNHGKNMGKIMKYLVGGFEPVEPSEK